MTDFVLSELVYSITNSDGTITISPSLGTGLVTASLALSHINMWTASQGNTASWNAYNTSADTQPQVQIAPGGTGGGTILLGIGGTTSPTVTLQYGGAPGVLYLTTGTTNHNANLAIFANGSPGGGDSTALLTLYGVTGTNFEYMTLGAYQTNSFALNIVAGGAGAVEPFLFESNTTEVARITPTPTFQFQPTTLTILGSSTGVTTITTANGSGTSYTATLPANGGTIAELNLAQVWSAVQTFGNNISFGGAAVSMSSLKTNQVTTYNGSNWVNASTVFEKGTVITAPVAGTYNTWYAPYACTVTAVRGLQDTGTGSVVTAYNGSNDICSSDVTCSVAATWESGSLNSSYTSFSAGASLIFKVVSVSGTPNYISIQVEFSRP